MSEGLNDNLINQISSGTFDESAYSDRDLSQHDDGQSLPQELPQVDATAVAFNSKEKAKADIPENYDPLNGVVTAQGYRAVISDGREIFIPTLPASVAVKNLGELGKYIGGEALAEIVKISIKHVKLAIIYAEDSEKVADLVKYFVVNVRIDGTKLDSSLYDSQFAQDLGLLSELFAHALRATYADFLA